MTRQRVSILALLIVVAALQASAADTTPKLIKLEYTYKFRTIRELSGFQMATFVAHFDRNLSLAGQLLGNYTYDAGDSASPVICINKDICTAIPLVSKLLQGAATMTCLGSKNETVVIDTLWSSGVPPQIAWPSASKVPSFLIPMGGVHDAVSALYHSLNVFKTDTLYRSSRTITFLLFLQIAHVFGPIPLRPSVITVDGLSTCSLRFNGTAARLTTDGKPLIMDTRDTGVTAKRLYFPCTYVDSQRTTGLLKTTLEALNISLAAVLDRAPWVFAALATSDALWGCIEQAKMPVPVRQALRPYNSTSCTFTPADPRYTGDPCCNQKLQYTQCCLPKGVSQAYELFSLSEVPDSAVPSQCRFRDQVRPALVSFASLLNAAEDPVIGCSADAAKNVNQAKMAEITNFPDDCDTKIFPGGILPTKTTDPLGTLKGNACTTSKDCLDGVPCINSACRPAVFTSQYEVLFGNCLMASMPPIVKRLFQMRFGLPANQTAAEFRASFEALMYHDNCVGGWQAYIYNRASGAYAVSNRTICEQHTECAQTKYLTSVTTKNCPAVTPDGRTGFCGTCPWGGYPCLEQFKEPAGCYQWMPTGDDGSCTKGGGTFFTVKAGCWLPNVTLPQCMPASVCPKYVSTPDTNRNIDGCINSVCYSTQLNATTCNSNAQLACKGPGRVPCTVSYQWSPTSASGQGLCIHPRMTKAQCPGLWKEAMFWYQGTVNTPDKCKAGVCNFDDQLVPSVNRTSCPQSNRCNRKCRACSGRTQAYTAACTAVLSATNCTKAGGLTDATYGTGLCVFDQEKAACVAANRTYSSCSDLTVSECALCDASKTDLTGCPASKMTLLPSKLLGCGIPETPFADCATSTECAATGMCDEVFTNIAVPSTTCVPDARGFFTDVRCNGACVLPFTISAQGQPSCATNQNATLYKNGCHSKTFATQAACEKAKYTWKVLPQTSDLCIASSGLGCFEKGRTTTPGMKNASECGACTPTVPLASIYRPVTSWNAGLWKAGKVVDEDWEWRPRGPIKTLRWGRTLDRTMFRALLNDFAAARNGPFVKSELLCRYSPLASAVTAISCSCDAGGPSKCFSGSVSVLPVGAQRFCAGIGDSVRMGIIMLRVARDTVPDSIGCIDFGVGLTSSRQFVRDVASLSSTDISSLTIGGAFSVLRNEYGSTVGQLLSDGAQLSWTGLINSPIVVCLDADRGIPEESDRFSELDFAKLQSSSADASTAVFTPMDVVVTKSPEGLYCASVSKTGTFFLVRREVGWRDIRVTATSVPLAIRIFLIIESVAFGVLSCFALGSLISAVAFQPSRWTNVSPQKIILFLIWVFAALRCTWLAMNGAEATSLVSGVGTSILSELPIFNSYSIFTTLIIFWIQSVSGSSSGRRYGSKLMAIPTLFLNIVLYVFYAGMLVAFMLVPNEQKMRVAIAYKIVLASLSVVTVLAFWISGARLLLLLKEGRDEQRQAQRVHMTVVVSVTSLCLVGQVAFMLAGATIDAAQQKIFAWVLVFVFYTLVELVPFAFLAHLLFGNVVRRKTQSSVRFISNATSSAMSKNSQRGEESIPLSTTSDTSFDRYSRPSGSYDVDT